jgi:hypothetical protein
MLFALHTVKKPNEFKVVNEEELRAKLLRIRLLAARLKMGGEK